MGTQQFLLLINLSINGGYMQNILTLPLCQGSFPKEKNHENANNQINYGIIDGSHQLSESTMPSLEEISVAKAKEALRKMLLPTKEAAQIFSNLEQLRAAVKISNERKSKEQLPANITETPKFHEAKSESTQLSDSANPNIA